MLLPIQSATAGTTPGMLTSTAEAKPVPLPTATWLEAGLLLPQSTTGKPSALRAILGRRPPSPPAFTSITAPHSTPTWAQAQGCAKNNDNRVMIAVDGADLMILGSLGG